MKTVPEDPKRTECSARQGGEIFTSHEPPPVVAIPSYALMITIVDERRFGPTNS